MLATAEQEVAADASTQAMEQKTHMEIIAVGTMKTLGHVVSTMTMILLQKRCVVLATVEALILIMPLKMLAMTRTMKLPTQVAILAAGTMEMKTCADSMTTTTLWQECTAVLVAAEAHMTQLVIMLVLSALIQSTKL